MKKFNDLNKKQQNTFRDWFRFAIQLLFFILVPGAYSGAFAGVKYIATQLGMSQLIELTSFVLILIVLLGFTIIFGRFFCGFACAFGSMSDWLYSAFHFLLKKLKKKSFAIPSNIANILKYLKYAVLIVILILLYLGKGDLLTGTSCWDVFSRLRALNFNLEGYGIGLAILILVAVGMCLEERFFCRFLCPMGAVFSLLPVLPFFSLKRDRGNCLPGCSACTRKCPANVELPSNDTISVSSECIMCQKCISTCPRGNISSGKKIKGNEFVFTLLRAFVLLALLIYLGL